MKKKYLAIFLLSSMMLVGCGADGNKNSQDNKDTITAEETNSADNKSNTESNTAESNTASGTEDEPIDIGDPNVPEGQEAEGNDEIKIGAQGMTEEDATYIVAQLVDSSKYAFKTEEQSVVIDGEDYYIIRLVDYDDINVEVDPPLAVNKTTKKVYIYENKTLSDFDASKFK